MVTELPSVELSRLLSDAPNTEPSATLSDSPTLTPEPTDAPSIFLADLQIYHIFSLAKVFDTHFV